MVPILHCLQPEHILGTVTKLVVSNYSVPEGVTFPLSRSYISEAFLFIIIFFIFLSDLGSYDQEVHGI